MKNKWLHFSMDKENIFGLLCGFLMILLSIAMALFHSEILNIILRDIFMILLLGFFTPVYYILVVKKKDLSVFGLHKNRLTVSLVINVIAGASLLAMFISKNTEDMSFHINSFYAVTYIFAAGIFEMIFIYGFLRYEFERAFGILPAIFITAVFLQLTSCRFSAGIYKVIFCWHYVCNGFLFYTQYFCNISIFLGCWGCLGCSGKFRSR